MPFWKKSFGDMVTVINTKMGFQKQAKVISYEWDCLMEQYNDVELGISFPRLRHPLPVA